MKPIRSDCRPDIAFVHDALAAAQAIAVANELGIFARLANGPADPAGLAAFKSDPKLERLSDLFTVGLIVRYIQGKVK